MDKEDLNNQAFHWENKFTNKPEMFGSSPSAAALISAKMFKRENVNNILELGAGQGRDCLFFAKNNFYIQALDYSYSGVKSIIKKANLLNLSQFITAKCYDVRKQLPFNDNTFDSCFSHMLYCMAFTTKELEFLSNEIHRVLKPGGLNVYTVRHTGDADYGTGIHRGEDLYETGGFIVHFFSQEKVKLLSAGYKIINVENFEEGTFPRKLFRVTLKRNIK